MTWTGRLVDEFEHLLQALDLVLRLDAVRLERFLELRMLGVVDVLNVS